MQPNNQPQPQVNQAAADQNNGNKAGLFKSRKTNPNSSQNILKIAEIRDGIVIMNDGTYRAVVFTKSINFDLMSNKEREAIELGYQGFLNSLYFPTQIFMRSQHVDISQYLERLSKKKTDHDNLLLNMFMDNYMSYIRALTTNINVMDKKFYIVIPFYPNMGITEAKDKGQGVFAGILNIFKGSGTGATITINEQDLEDAKNELTNRVQAILGGLSNLGVQGVALNTQELIELYYDYYNPDTATNQHISAQTAIDTPIIKRGGMQQDHLKSI